MVIDDRYFHLIQVPPVEPGAGVGDLEVDAQLRDQIIDRSLIRQQQLDFQIKSSAGAVSRVDNVQTTDYVAADVAVVSLGIGGFNNTGGQGNLDGANILADSATLTEILRNQTVAITTTTTVRNIKIFADTIAALAGADAFRVGVAADEVKVTTVTEGVVTFSTTDFPLARFGGSSGAVYTVIEGDDGANTFTNSSENELFLGYFGTDTVNVSNVTSTGLVVNLVAGTGYGTGTGGGLGSDIFIRVENLTAAGATFAVSLTGNTDANILTGGNGNDTLDGDADADTLHGGAGNDSLFGSAGVDTLNGDAGNDKLDGGAGGDTLNGGADTDTASYATATAGLTAALIAPGINTGFASGDSYTSIENLEGSNHNDHLIGDNNSNTLSGGSGDDKLDGRGGAADVLDGGTGTDTASYAGASVGVVANLGSPAGNTNEAAGDTYTSIENLEGSLLADTLTGDGLSNTITGSDGNDIIVGGGGIDLLLGGNNDDTITLDVADLGGANAEQVNGGANTDILQVAADVSLISEATSKIEAFETVQLGTLVDLTITVQNALDIANNNSSGGAGTFASPFLLTINGTVASSTLALDSSNGTWDTTTGGTLLGHVGATYIQISTNLL